MVRDKFHQLQAHHSNKEKHSSECFFLWVISEQYPPNNQPPHSLSGFDRSPQLRGDRSGTVAIEDCCIWLIMAENLFSKTIIWQRQRFATANNCCTQISRPKRHRLTGFVNGHKKRRLKSRLDFVGVDGFEPPTLCL